MIKEGEVFTLSDNARAMCFTKIGGLQVKVLKVHEPYADVEITCTGSTYQIYVGYEEESQTKKKDKMKVIAKILTVLFSLFSVICFVLAATTGNWVMLVLVFFHYLVTMAGANYAKSKGRCYWKGFALCWNYPVFGHIFIALLKEKRVFKDR